MGMPSIVKHLKPENNVYKNPFGTEIAMMRTLEDMPTVQAPRPIAAQHEYQVPIQLQIDAPRRVAEREKMDEGK